MDKVKTYQKVDSQKGSASFAISKMEDVYIRRNGQTDEPHRHDYFTVLVVENASGWHKIDFNTYELSSSQVFFVAPGQVHQVIENEKSIGFVMTFSHQFLIENSIPLSFISSLNLFQSYGQSPPLSPEKNDFVTIEKFSNQIFDLFHGDTNMKNLSIGSFLKLLLIKCNNICSVNPVASDVDTSGDNLLRSFKTVVDENYKKEHSSAYYASELNISTDHLNRIVKTKIGKTTKEYIQSRIITEAKRLLFFTDLSNKEIGYELGFNEPANFSAFFKKMHPFISFKFQKKGNEILMSDFY